MNYKTTHPADQVVEIINRIYNYSMTTTSGGNISTMDAEGNIFITPGSVDKGSLTRHDIMKITPSGEFIGPHKPSSEYPFHKKVYQMRPDLKAVVHAHSPALVAFAITKQIPNVNLTSHIKSMCSKISRSAYALPGSLKLGDIIAAEFEKGFDIVMMDAHSVVIGAKDLETAFIIFETLDFCARIQINAASIGTIQEIENEHIPNIHSIPELDEFICGDYSNEEIDFRNHICSLMSRAYDQRLVNSSTGTLSQRTGDDSFIITPYMKDRKLLKPEDIVKISSGKRELGKFASRAVMLHDEIYKTHPEINSIFMAQPPNIMAFAIIDDSVFDSRLIPESYIMLRDVKKLPFTVLKNYREISDVIGKDSPVILIENECVITVGNSILQAFDRLEVLEYSANSVISAMKFGEISAITPEEVEEIDKNFKVW